MSAAYNQQSTNSNQLLSTANECRSSANFHLSTKHHALSQLVSHVFATEVLHEHVSKWECGRWALACEHESIALNEVGCVIGANEILLKAWIAGHALALG